MNTMNTTLTDLANAYEVINRTPDEDKSPYVREVLYSILAAIKRLADQVGNEKTQTADERPWMPWRGGACPVIGSAKIEVKCRNGDIETSEARGFIWSHDQGPHDIIAFRLATQDSQE